MIIWASYILYILHLTILRFVLRKAVGNWLKNYIWFIFLISKIVYNKIWRKSFDTFIEPNHRNCNEGKNTKKKYKKNWEVRTDEKCW